MQPSLPVRASSRAAVLIAAAVSLALTYSTLSGELLRALIAQPSFAYQRSLLASLSDVLVMLLLIALAAKRSPIAVLQSTGIGASPLRPLLWIGLVMLPTISYCLIALPLAVDLTATTIVWPVFGGPLFEELLYRGLAVGVLMRWCGWRFAPACIWPALFFGLVHAAQGADPVSIGGVVAITAAGGLLFGWLFVRWNFNLWPPLLLHIGLNAQWTLFALGDSAIGSQVGNVLRLVVVVLAILATVWLAPKSTQSSRGGDSTD
jgi:uncharacterized protein